MAVTSTKLYVGNLPEMCRRTDLKKVFDKYGQVLECDIIKNYGFVHYTDPGDAAKAADELNGVDFDGAKIHVEVSHSKVRQKPGMGGKGECYRCGGEGHWSKDCPKRPKSRMRHDYDEMRRPAPYPSDPYRDPYREAYYRDRYAAMDRYRGYPDPYARRLPPPPRELYYRDRDPYARPPPEYFARARRSPASDPYYDYYERSYALPPPPGTARASPPPIRSRAAPY